MQVGLHASHEQFPPSYLLRVARQAEAAGFGAVLSSDHLAPWSRSQGNAGFAWTWLGAVAATTQLPMGIVTAPVDRYHPVIVAQARARHSTSTCPAGPGPTRACETPGSPKRRT